MHGTLASVCIVLLALSGTCLGQEAGQRQPRPRRMYFGAPPTIPHDAGPDMNDCLMCHGAKDSGAPMTPHPTHVRCRQCHVADDEKAGDFRRNGFAGLAIPGPAPRMSTGAPPAIPHPVLLRENCLACHAPGARKDVISTSHPQRERCQQCHVPIHAQASGFRRE